MSRQSSDSDELRAPPLTQKRGLSPHPADSGEALSDSPHKKPRAAAAEEEYPWWHPDFDRLADKIKADGGFPAKLGKFVLHPGIAVLNESEMSVTSKLGAPVAQCVPLNDTAYLDPRFAVDPGAPPQSVFNAFFGTAKDRRDTTKFNEQQSTVTLQLANVQQQDLVRFQGLPPWDRTAEEGWVERSKEEIYESIKESTVYRMLEKSFDMELATKLSRPKLSKEHLKGASDGKYLDRYVRERLAGPNNVDSDDPYDPLKTNFKWLGDKTGLHFPLTKDEETDEWRTFTDAADGDADAARRVRFSLDLPLSFRDGEPELRERGPPFTRVAEDGTKRAATAADLVRDFPSREAVAMGTNVPIKRLMVSLQYDTYQSKRAAAPALRCKVKAVSYTVSEGGETCGAALDRINS